MSYSTFNSLRKLLAFKKYTQISLTKFQLWVRHRRSLLKRQSVCRVPELNYGNGKMTWRENCAQAIGMTVTLRGLWRKVDSRTWESFTRSGLILVSVDHAQISSGKGVQLLHSNIKPLPNSVVQRIQMRFSDERKFGNQAPRLWRTESHKIQGVLSPLWSLSNLWFGVPCHLLVKIFSVR